MNYKYLASRFKQPCYLPRTDLRVITKPKWLWRSASMQEDGTLQSDAANIIDKSFVLQMDGTWYQ